MCEYASLTSTKIQLKMVQHNKIILNTLTIIKVNWLEMDTHKDLKRIFTFQQSKLKWNIKFIWKTYGKVKEVNRLGDKEIYLSGIIFSKYS